jgi:hypothetical protein
MKDSYERRHGAVVDGLLRSGVSRISKDPEGSAALLHNVGDLTEGAE